MKKLLAGVAVTLALGISTASADGIDRKYSPIASSPPIYAPTWSGFYIGAGVGGGAVVHDISVRDTFFDERLFDFRGGDSGVLGTVIVGWDWQLGPKTVFGIFGDFDFFDFSSRHRMLDVFDHSIDHDNAWSVGARLGVLSSPSTLWYVTGGFTQLQLDHSVRFFDLDELSFHRDRSVDGFFVGGGVDTRLAGSNWFLRLEYRFSQYDNENLRIDDLDTNINADLESHTARLTLTYKVTPGYGWGGLGGWSPQ